MISSLSQRVIRGFIRLQLVLAILLFLPAGSIRFWEAWLYWGLFGGSVLFITRYFLKVDPDFVERRMQIGPGAEPSNTQQVVQLHVRCVGMRSLPGRRVRTSTAGIRSAGIHRTGCRRSSGILHGNHFPRFPCQSLCRRDRPGRSEPTGGFERTLCDRSPPAIRRKHPWVSGDTFRPWLALGTPVRHPALCRRGGPALG